MAARGGRAAAKKIPKVGVLWHAGSAEEEGVYVEALRKGLSDFGYVEGHNIILEDRFPGSVLHHEAGRLRCHSFPRQAARMLGLTLPDKLLALADEVIE